MQTINSCRVCKSENIETFFDLGEQPLANSLLKDLDQKENFYPLSLSYCHDCGLAQLNQTIDPKVLFSDYVWVTDTSKVARDFSEIFYKEIVARTKDPKKNYVLEVASNDGTFLMPFIHHDYRVLGVDPAQNVAEAAKQKGVATKCCFFGKEAAEELLKEQGQAEIVFARNVLPHVANTRDFVEGLSVILANEGTLAIEAHYAKKILEELHYDSIYHEHLCYFSFKSLEKLLNDFGLYVFDIIESPISGGSMVVYAKKKKIKEAPAVQLYRDAEKENKTNSLESWQNFAQRAFLHRQKLLGILQNVSKSGELIVGYGASARSSTLLNFCGVGPKIVPAIADQNPLKQRLFTAGTHIQIDSPEELMRQNPKYILILAWNFTNEIIDNLKNRFNYKGSVIVPLPDSPYLKEQI